MGSSPAPSIKPVPYQFTAREDGKAWGFPDGDVLYVVALISVWLFLFPLFLFAAQLKEFFLDGLKKLEQRSHKCVELRGEYVE
jgi:hypothetical protein